MSTGLTVSSSQTGQQLTSDPLHHRVNRLVQNEMHTTLSRRFDLGQRIAYFTKRRTSTPEADGWEAYLAALLISNGRRAVLEFYAPLMRRYYLDRQLLHRFDRLPDVKTSAELSLQGVASREHRAPEPFAKSYPAQGTQSAPGEAPTTSAQIARTKTEAITAQIQAAPNLVPVPRALMKLKWPAGCAFRNVIACRHSERESRAHLPFSRVVCSPTVAA